VTATPRAIELAVAAAEAASDKLGRDIVAIDVSDQLVITDIFVIASGGNEPQVKAICDSVEKRLHGLGVRRLRREGHAEGRWVLLDFGDIVVHVQLAEERVFYDLERLWRDCPSVELPESVTAGAGPSSDA